MNYETILFERQGAVALITLNRPKALNALCAELFEELKEVIDLVEADDDIAVVVLTGNEKAFAAGADILEMKDQSYIDMLSDKGMTKNCACIAGCSKPVIAAVAGYALGGGCELAMMCDFIIAADNAKFGQPEITIGTVPGFGGSQRLTGLVGKSKAMDMCLTGRMMDADEAERAGLVSRVESSCGLNVETAGQHFPGDFAKPGSGPGNAAVQGYFCVGRPEGRYGRVYRKA